MLFRSNIYSVVNAMKRLGISPILTDDAETLRKAARHGIGVVLQRTVDVSLCLVISFEEINELYGNHQAFKLEEL